jgi:hypothetical protein
MVTNGQGDQAETRRERTVRIVVAGKGANGRGYVLAALGDGLGVRLTDVRPDCTIDRAVVERFHRAWRELPRPHITVNRHASSWTPNKDWPEAYWTELIWQLSQTAGVIEIGAAGASPPDAPPRESLEVRTLVFFPPGR